MRWGKMKDDSVEKGMKGREREVKKVKMKKIENSRPTHPHKSQH
jgi:hypothetical protein